MVYSQIFFPYIFLLFKIFINNLAFITLFLNRSVTSQWLAQCLVHNRYSTDISWMKQWLMYVLCSQRLMGQKLARGIDRLCNLLHLLCLGSAFSSYTKEMSMCSHIWKKYFRQVIQRNNLRDHWYFSTPTLFSILTFTAQPPASLTWLIQCNAIQPSPKLPPQGHICPSLPCTAVGVLFLRGKLEHIITLFLKWCNAFLFTK